MKSEDTECPSLHIMNADALEFNLEDVLTEWANDKDINLAIVDIPHLTEKHIQIICARNKYN